MSRDTSDRGPLAREATGQWVRHKGSRWQRYDEAPPYDGTTHWYKRDSDASWHAFRISDIKPDPEEK